MKQTWSIINNFCKINNKEVNITLKINETIITDTQVIVDKFNIFFSKIGDQVISELEKNNNVNVSYKQYCRILLKNDTEGVEVGYCNIYSSSTQYKTGSLQYREQYT